MYSNGNGIGDGNGGGDSTGNGDSNGSEERIRRLTALRDSLQDQVHITNALTAIEGQISQVVQLITGIQTQVSNMNALHMQLLAQNADPTRISELDHEIGVMTQASSRHLNELSHLIEQRGRMHDLLARIPR